MLSSMNISKISLLFTSDEHGQLKPAPKLQSVIAQTRQDNPGGTLLVSSGDVFQGSAETEILGTKASSDLLRLAKYDVMTLGNHDFDNGVQATRDWVNQAPCTVLSANVLEADGRHLTGTLPAQIRDLNGAKLGLIGVTTPDTASILSKSKLDGLQFADPSASVAEQIKNLKRDGAELIGVVSHLGIEADRVLAASTQGIDFILGGHSHVVTEQPERVGQTLIAHPGSYRQGMGKMEINFDTDSDKVTGVEFSYIRPDAETPTGGSERDDSVKVWVDAQEAVVDASFGQVVGDLPRKFTHDPDNLRDPLEVLVGKAVLKTTKGDLMTFNQKGIRAPLADGPVTKKDIFTVFPFDSVAVNLELPARDVQSLYAESFRRFDQTSLTVEGRLKVASDIETHELFLADEHNHRLDPGQTVTVTTSSYIQEGGLDYLKPGLPVKESFPTFRAVLEDYIKETYPSTTSVEKR